MLHLLNLEWKKLRSYNAFRVLMGMYLLFLPTVLLVTKSIKEYPPPINTSDTFFRFPEVFMFLGYAGNWLVFFTLGFLGVLYITQEYAHRTLRQNIITGLSRRDFFLSKFYFLIAISLFATLYYWLVAMVYGYTHTPTSYASLITKNLDYVPRYFLMCMGYMSFGLLIGTLVRRGGIAIFLYFAYGMFLELILRWVVHLNVWNHQSMHFYPMNVIEDLAPIPFSEAAEGFEKEYNFSFFLSPTEAIIAGCLYVGLFLGLTYWRLRRADL